jgi:putative colanic acid biosysnthesis UDP-glucose lipid carrier transferase
MQQENYLTLGDTLISPIEDIREKHEGYSLERIAKRGIDIMFALTVIILLFSWILPIVALIIKLTSKGPVFFLQSRIGLNNEIFQCWKLRTMYIDSDANSFKATEKEDSRITSVGGFLRRLNLDELPQIINILLGDMTLVGPRPQPIPFYHKYKEFIEDLDLRHVVKPGITGYAQIRGLRGDSADENENKMRIWKRFECDMWYIENWSLRLDIEIIVKTFLIVLKGDDNAY